MRSFSGREMPVPGTRTEDNDVAIVDVVFSMGRIRRYGGQGSPEWTLLHHSALTMMLALRAGIDPRDAARYFLHDAGEAVMGFDPPGPMKVALRRFEGALCARTCEMPPNASPIDKLERWCAEKVWKALGYDASRWAETGAPGSPLAVTLKACDWAALVIETVYFGPPGALDDVCERLREVPHEKFGAEIRRNVVEVVERADGTVAARFKSKLNGEVRP